MLDAGFNGCASAGMVRVPAASTLASASELRRGLEAERLMPSTVGGGLLGSWPDSDSPAKPRVVELPAFLRDVLQEPGASGAGGLPRSSYRDGRSLLFSVVMRRKQALDAPPPPPLYTVPFSLGWLRGSLAWR